MERWSLARTPLIQDGGQNLICSCLFSPDWSARCSLLWCRVKTQEVTWLWWTAVSEKGERSNRYKDTFIWMSVSLCGRTRCLDWGHVNWVLYIPCECRLCWGSETRIEHEVPSLGMIKICLCMHSECVYKGMLLSMVCTDSLRFDQLCINTLIVDTTAFNRRYF